jgi:hypothetical protein
MTMLVRMAGYPARYVLGYLPGAVDEHTLVEQVTRDREHAWVEVYFIGYGWVPFDPTGGSVGIPTELPPGSEVTPGPTPSFETPAPSESLGPEVSPSGGGNGSTAPGAGSTTIGPGLPLLPVLFGVFLAGLLVVWFVRPKRPQDPQEVYRSVVRLASRVGYRPRANQTVYEYTGMLADVVPGARDPLGVVATATVEVTYGKRRLGAERLSALAAAYELVRRALLRLAFRLPRRAAAKEPKKRRR